jgi:hypothetical protein
MEVQTFKGDRFWSGSVDHGLWKRHSTETAEQKWIELTHHVFADAKPSMVAPLPRADERYPSFWLGWRDLHHRKTKHPWRTGESVEMKNF